MQSDRNRALAVPRDVPYATALAEALEAFAIESVCENAFDGFDIDFRCHLCTIISSPRRSGEKVHWKPPSGRAAGDPSWKA